MDITKVAAFNCIVVVAVVAFVAHHAYRSAPMPPVAPTTLPTSASVLAAFRSNSNKIIACGYAGGCDKVHVDVFILGRNNNFLDHSLAGKINIEIWSGVTMADYYTYTDRQRAAESQAAPNRGDAVYSLAKDGNGYDLLDGEGKPVGHEATTQGAIAEAIDTALFDFARNACSPGYPDWCAPPAAPKTDAAKGGGFPVSEDVFVNAYVKANLGQEDDYTPNQLAQLARDAYTMAKGLGITTLRDMPDSRSKRAVAYLAAQAADQSRQ